MMKFKVGDRVKRNDVEKDSEYTYTNKSAGVMKVIKVVDDETIRVELSNGKSYPVTNKYFKFVGSSKNPTHLVVWDEDTDPCKFFESEDEAKEFIKKLSEKSEVVKDSIVLVEIKSARRVTIQKSLRYLKYTI